MEKNGLFYGKRRLVLGNAMGEDDTEKFKLKNEKLKCEKTYNLPSRAYARARNYRSFYFFAITSVTRLFLKYWLSVYYDGF